MKIIQVISSLTGRGAERICLELHRNFKALGHKSKIYITHNINDFDDENVMYIPADKITEQLKKEKYDLLIGHMTHAAKVLREFKSDPRVYQIIHTTLSAKLQTEPFLKRMESYIKLRLVYGNANIICVSQWVENDLIKKLKIKPATVQTIYNPFDFEKIRSLGSEKVGLPFKYLIAVGSLSKVKRYDLLLKAYATLNTDLHLVILGKGEEELKLKKLAAALQIEERVHFLGWVSNPYKYIANAEVFVSTSDIEGLPSVVIESLILGIPVVATDCPSGIREIMTDKLAEYLPKTSDYPDIAKKIAKAIESYPSIDEMNLKKFEVNSVMKKYLELLLENK